MKLRHETLLSAISLCSHRRFSQGCKNQLAQSCFFCLGSRRRRKVSRLASCVVLGPMLPVKVFSVKSCLLLQKWTWHDIEMSDEYCSPAGVFHSWSLRNKHFGPEGFFKSQNARNIFLIGITFCHRILGSMDVSMEWRLSHFVSTSRASISATQGTSTATIWSKCLVTALWPTPKNKTRITPASSPNNKVKS